MGYYVETDQLKLKHLWIEQYLGGKILPAHEILIKKTDDTVPVVVVNNGPFEAAGIAYSKAEWEAFTESDDPRPKKFLLVSKAALIKHNPKLEGIFQW